MSPGQTKTLMDVACTLLEPKVESARVAHLETSESTEIQNETTIFHLFDKVNKLFTTKFIQTTPHVLNVALIPDSYNFSKV